TRPICYTEEGVYETDEICSAGNKLWFTGWHTASTCCLRHSYSLIRPTRAVLRSHLVQGAVGGATTVEHGHVGWVGEELVRDSRSMTCDNHCGPVLAQSFWRSVESGAGAGVAAYNILSPATFSTARDRRLSVGQQLHFPIHHRHQGSLEVGWRQE